MPVLIVAFAATAAAAPELSAAAIAAISTIIAAGGTAATGGIYYYREEIYNGITNLFASAYDELNHIKKNQIEIDMRQKQPAIIAEAAVANAITHVDAIVAQTKQQQTCIEESVQQFTETVNCAQNATQTLDNMAQPLLFAAINAVNSTDVIEKELSHVNETMTMATTALNASNDGFSNVTRHIGETHTKLSSTLTQLTTDTLHTDFQLTRLADQQHARNAVAVVDHYTIDHDELAAMKNKIRTLSHNFLTLIKENRALMTENSALKKALSGSLPKRRFSSGDTHPKHDDTDRPSKLN